MINVNNNRNYNVKGIIDSPTMLCGKITVMHGLSWPFALFKPNYHSVGDAFVSSGVSLGGQRGACGAVTRVWHCATLTLFSLSLLEQMDQTHGAALTAETQRGQGVGTAIFSTGHTLPPCV